MELFQTLQEIQWASVDVWPHRDSTGRPCLTVSSCAVAQRTEPIITGRFDSFIEWNRHGSKVPPRPAMAMRLNGKQVTCVHGATGLCCPRNGQRIWECSCGASAPAATAPSGVGRRTFPSSSARPACSMTLREPGYRPSHRLRTLRECVVRAVRPSSASSEVPRRPPSLPTRLFVVELAGTRVVGGKFT